jgi:hypothetical protein
MDADERLFVRPAVRMASTGDLDPYWFGHPASTTFYPLAALIHAEDVLRHGGAWLDANPDVLARFRADPGPFVELGRGLSILYALLGLLLVWLVGSRLEGPPVAALATVWAMLPSVSLVHAQTVRSDSAGTFWALLALLLLVEAAESGSRSRLVLAGAAAGLAVASRYLLAALLGPLALVGVLRVVRAPDPVARRRAILPGVAALLLVPAAFLLATPYFLPEMGAVLHDLGGEARLSHPGADGLSPLGNLLFYGGVWRQNLGWPVTILGLYGALLALRRGRPGARLLALFLVLFMATICLSRLHWSRWTIQALPVLALLGASGLADLVRRLAAPGGQRWLFAASAGLVSLPPLWAFGPTAARQACPTTRLLARSWALATLPSGANLVTERGTLALVPRHWSLEAQLTETRKDVLYEASLPNQTFHVRLVSALVRLDGSLEGLRAPGGAYVVVSTEPEALEWSSLLYGQLEREGRRVARFEPAWFRAGPALEVYWLPPTGAGPSAAP